VEPLQKLGLGLMCGVGIFPSGSWVKWSSKNLPLLNPICCPTNEPLTCGVYILKPSKLGLSFGHGLHNKVQIRNYVGINH
jgi:hypothetical protein